VGYRFDDHLLQARSGHRAGDAHLLTDIAQHDLGQNSPAVTFSPPSSTSGTSSAEG
jgi:hypothetical protein